MIIKDSYVEFSKYGGIAIDEYEGNYKLVKAYEGTDEKIYAEWAYPQDKDRNPRKAALPVGVNIGRDRHKIIDVLNKYVQMFLKMDGEVDDGVGFKRKNGRIIGGSWPSGEKEEEGDVFHTEIKGKVSEYTGEEEDDIPF